MRKVTEKVCRAFICGDKKTISNTSTDGMELRLHGNLIARKEQGAIILSDCGWQTRTTQDRLNGLLSLLNTPSRIYQKKFRWYLWTQNKEVDIEWNREALIYNKEVTIL